MYIYIYIYNMCLMSRLLKEMILDVSSKAQMYENQC